MNNLEENYKKILEVLRELDKKENYRKQIRKPKMTDKEIIALNFTAEYLSIDLRTSVVSIIVSNKVINQNRTVCL